MTILGRSGELVSRCVECDLAEPESLASLGGYAPGVVDGILSRGARPINDFLIPPTISNRSKLQGKFMPAFFCVIKLVHFYAFQVILIITHFDEIYPSLPYTYKLDFDLFT